MVILFYFAPAAQIAINSNGTQIAGGATDLTT